MIISKQQGPKPGAIVEELDFSPALLSGRVPESTASAETPHFHGEVSVTADPWV
ncbi:hypothetical protein ACI2L1_42410 [Streptomyces sp. NPDC019531]|uniref:hypothetical protein n=1 Tax=Streptomyces sp. NPDC019531 TaxID=3365062 RepID=UPI00384EE20C